MTTSTITTTPDFRTAEAAQRFVAARSGVDAKINAKINGTVDPGFGSDLGPDGLRLGLEILVTFGFLTREQAQALFHALTEGSYVDLVPLPAPEGLELKLPLYNMIRASLMVSADSVDAGVLDTIWDIVAHIGPVLDALEDIGHFFADLFS